MNRIRITCAAALLPLLVAASPPAGGNRLTVARPATDTARDADRKPAAMLAFAQVKPGETVVDWTPGGGYFTRLFSNAVGSRGIVYAVTPETFHKKFPPKTLVSNEPGHANVRELVAAPDTSLNLPKPADLVWTAQNYHDIQIFFGGVASDAAFNKAVFAALKPGGRYVIVDHAGAAALDAKGIDSLHRIDVAQVKREVLAAGFVLDGESAALANPADDRSKTVFDPAIRGKTDQFALRFRKPG